MPMPGRSVSEFVKLADWVCARFYEGYSPDQITPAVHRGNPGVSARQAQVFVSASIDAYCPPSVSNV